MKIVYKQGDMFKHQFPKEQVWRAFAHGCNAQGVMGSGVAAQIKKIYPWAYERYMEAYNTSPSLQVGDVVPATQMCGKTGITTVLNLITQQYYGRDKDVVYVDYNGLEKCFIIVDEECAQIKNHDNSPIEIVMPKIGAGLANGDWNIISEIIERTSTHYQPVVYSL